jgi:hypothetical protein
MNNNYDHINLAKTWLFQKHKKSSYVSIVSALFVPLLILLTVSFSIDSVLAQAYHFIASTRGSFGTADGSMVHQDKPTIGTFLQSVQS